MDYKAKATILRVCSSRKGERCSHCPAFGKGDRNCFKNAMRDGSTAITDLLARAEAAEARAEKAERKRDAAVRDLRQMCVGGNTCAFCKHGRNCGKQGPGRKTVEPCWEWRGQKEE